MGEYSSARQQRLSRYGTNRAGRARTNDRVSSRRNAPQSELNGFFSTLRDRLPEPPSSKVGRIGLIVVAAIAVLLLFLYGPVREYYVSWRVGQIYSAELAELNEDNEELKSEVNRLQSREGIEDEARKRGYVSEGETAVTVEGLDESETSDGETGDTSDASGESNNPWYISVLDVLFGFDKTSVSVS